MDRRDRYRRKAADLLKAAEILRDPIERKKLLELALGYLALARHVAERRHQGTAHRSMERHPEHTQDDA